MSSKSQFLLFCNTFINSCIRDLHYYIFLLTYNIDNIVGKISIFFSDDLNELTSLLC